MTPTQRLQASAELCGWVGRLFGRTTPQVSGMRTSSAGLIYLEDSYGNRVDLLTGLRGLDPEAKDRVIGCDFEGTQLRIASAEDLIAMKLFAGSPREIEDGDQVLARRRERISVALLKPLALRFGRRERAA